MHVTIYRNGGTIHAVEADEPGLTWSVVEVDKYGDPVDPIDVAPAGTDLAEALPCDHTAGLPCPRHDWDDVSEHRTGRKLPDGSWEPAPYSDWNDANPS